MRAKAMLLVVAVVALSIGGCSAVIVSRGIEATDLSAIVVGADRETVEGALGSPIDSVETKAGRIDTYLYDRGRAPKKTGRVPSIDLSGAHPNIGYALPLIGLGLLIAQPILIHNLYEDQKGELSITYGADDKVVRVETAAERGRRELAEEFSVIRIGATRAQVEEVLGEPDHSESHADATIQVYRRQRDSAHVVMYVTYGPDGMVARAETASQLRRRRQNELREDLSIARIGATRDQVEDALGAPDHSERGEDGTIHVYRHPWGSTSDAMHVTCGPDGTVTLAETAEQRRERDKRWDMADLSAKAKCGDARAVQAGFAILDRLA